jgi:hypothetical protein
MWQILTAASIGDQGLLDSVTPFPWGMQGGQGLCHGHCYLFNEAGQVYVSFLKARTLMGAQGDVDLEQNQKFRAGWPH